MAVVKGLPDEWIDKLPTFDWTEFRIDKKIKRLANDASTLGFPPGFQPNHIAVNGKKGKVAFYLNHKISSDMVWQYIPFLDYIEKNPKLKGWSITIWND